MARTGDIKIMPVIRMLKIDTLVPDIHAINICMGSDFPGPMATSHALLVRNAESSVRALTDVPDANAEDEPNPEGSARAFA
ncbi:hypothetical protein IWW43_004401, partial [Coemansia sp. RSA 1935]